MNEIEKLKSEIKVLQAKVEFLEELKVYKTPAQEAYKEYCGEYPPTNPSVDNIDDLSWEYFQAGWNAAQPKDAEVNETPKPITLSTIIAECMVYYNNTVEVSVLEKVLDRVEVEWLPKRYQSYSEYNEGWNNCVDELKGKLRNKE